MIRLNRNLKYSRTISNKAPKGSAFQQRTFCDQVWSAACESSFSKRCSWWLLAVLLRSMTRYHPPLNYVKRECLVAQQCERCLFPATYPVIPKQMRLQFFFSFPSSDIGLCIWDNVFFFTIPVDEVVHTKHTFAAASPMLEHFNSMKIRGNPSFGSHYSRFWPVLHHG